MRCRGVHRVTSATDDASDLLAPAIRLRATGVASMELVDLLHAMVGKRASDLHIKVGSPPGIRVHGDLVPIEGVPILTQPMAAALIEELLDDKERQIYEATRDPDFSKHLEGIARSAKILSPDEPLTRSAR